MPSEEPSSAPARPRPVPGQKRARHKRWTRVATVVTVAVVGAFAVAIGFLLFPGEKEDSMVAGCRDYLAGIAEEVHRFADRKGRLPAALEDLRDPEGESPYDAEPWDCWHNPFEYRIVDASKRDFRLRSYGADEKPDTADDIVWPKGASWR